MAERLMSPSFPRSGVAGEWDISHWVVIQLSPEMPTLRNGAGQLLAVSDEAIVVRRNDTVRVEAVDGRPLGSIEVPSDTKGAPIAEVAGPGQLLLNLGGAYRIVDFHGKEVRRIRRPPGWGFRHGWSSDGRRVLFDNYTRKASIAERAVDAVGSIFVPVPEESNGEKITVVDTVTGKVCFQLEDSQSAFGREGQMHADISPSGSLVGIARFGKFDIYTLPETCSEN